MSYQLNTANQGQAKGFGELDSFHKELLLAGKEFERLQSKPAGTYKSSWNTTVEDKTVRDTKGNATYISVQRTQMSASYSYNNQKNDKNEDCVIL